MSVEECKGGDSGGRRMIKKNKKKNKNTNITDNTNKKYKSTQEAEHRRIQQSKKN